MNKHAFLMQVHDYPDLLERILTNMSNENHYFFIHVDAKSNVYSGKVIKKIKNNFSNILYFEKEMIVNHGGFSQIEATLLLLDNAFGYGGFDYYHLISGQDYPVVKNNTFDSFFENNEQSYMQYDSPENITKWRNDKYKQRTQLLHFTDFFGYKCIPVKVSYYLSRAMVRVARLLPYRRSQIHNTCGGWSWFSWHHNVVSFVIDNLKSNPSYLKRFKMTYCCDEIIFHTLLNEFCSELKINKYDSLRFVEWHPKRYASSLPLTLNESELEDIINSKSFFIRKVHPFHSKKLLQLIDEKIFD